MSEHIKAREERIKELEEELSKTKYNKRTQHAIGLLKAKIARLKEEKTKVSSKKSKHEGYHLPKSGDATAILVGFPSVGKSTLLNTITDAKSKIAAYAFTTLNVVPGTLEYKHTKIQILDVPGILEGASLGTGRGKEVLSVSRNAELILIVTDVFHPEYIELIKKELYNYKIRINQKRPDVKIKRSEKGGVKVGCTCKLTKITKDVIKETMREFGYLNADIIVREDINLDQLIDVIKNNRVYAPCLIVLSKVDLINDEELLKVKKLVKPDVCISCTTGVNIEVLKEKIYRSLKFIRVFTKEMGKKPKMDEPIIMKEGATVEEACRKIHKDFIAKFHYVKVWGKSAKFEGQKKGLDHVLSDEDVVEIHLR